MKKLPFAKPTPRPKKAKQFLPRRKTTARSDKAKRARKLSRAQKAARAKAEFARKYGGLDRVLFVKKLPCASCGVVGYSENAHVLGNDGLGRKQGYLTIAPLCGGCHRAHDAHRLASFTPEKAQLVAAQVEAAWQEHCGESPK